MKVATADAGRTHAGWTHECASLCRPTISETRDNDSPFQPKRRTWVMASMVKGDPATCAPCSVMATVWRPTSLQGTATLYARPHSASAAAMARPQPLGPVHMGDCLRSGQIGHCCFVGAADTHQRPRNGAPTAAGDVQKANLVNSTSFVIALLPCRRHCPPPAPPRWRARNRRDLLVLCHLVRNAASSDAAMAGPQACAGSFNNCGRHLCRNYGKLLACVLIALHSNAQRPCMSSANKPHWSRAFQMRLSEATFMLGLVCMAFGTLLASRRMLLADYGFKQPLGSERHCCIRDVELSNP